ncbi:hypothetical protein ACFL3Q_17420 [Planctomycetota bacterium]
MYAKKGVTVEYVSLVMISYCLDVKLGDYFAEAYNYLGNGDLTKRRLAT